MVDTSHTPIEVPPADVAGLKAALAEANGALALAGQAPTPVEPLPHDGWRSRRAVASSVAAGAIFSASTGMLVTAGLKGMVFFSADHWLTSLWAVAGVLAVGWGLMTIDKAIEVVKLIKGVNGAPK